MSRRNRASMAAVEKLIEQRRLFQDWLAKLDAGIEGMPPHVVERVRNDYRTRLTAVVTELSGHHEALHVALDEARTRHEELEKQQQARRDELAELRLRKHVGELEEERFKASSAELKQQIDAMSREIAATLRDMDRFEEILDLIASSPESRAAGAALQPEDESAAAGPAVTRPARGGKSEARLRSREVEKAPAEDELEFLRSVTGPVTPKRVTTVQAGRPPEREAAPAPPAVPAQVPAAPAAAAPAAAEMADPQPQAEEEPREELNAAPGLVDLPMEPEAPADLEAAGEEAVGTELEKSVKCKECGAMNLPTEWYCEKCGAELSAF